MSPFLCAQAAGCSGGAGVHVAHSEQKNLSEDHNYSFWKQINKIHAGPIISSQ